MSTAAAIPPEELRALRTLLDRPRPHTAGTVSALLNLLRQHAADLVSAAERVQQMQQWVNDLQSGMWISCVYCGHRYGPQDKVPATMADALKEHVERCEQHPMSALRRERDALLEDKGRLDLAEKLLSEGWQLDNWLPTHPEVYFRREETRDRDEGTPVRPTLREALDAARVPREGEDS